MNKREHDKTMKSRRRTALFVLAFWLLVAGSLLLSVSASAGDFYVRMGLVINPSQFERGEGKDPVLANPVATLGGRWVLGRDSNNHEWSFFFEHKSGLFSGESYAGTNELGLTLTF